jgi:hypothetical protein
MPPTPTALIIKQPLWKRSPYLFFVIFGLFIGYALNTQNELTAGILFAVFFSIIGFILFFIPQTALIVDSEGITPVCKRPKSAVTKIPWSSISRFDIKTVISMQNRGQGRAPSSSRQAFVEIFVNDQNFIAANPKLFRGVGSIFDRIIESSFEKNQSERPVYIPLLMLPWSINTAVEELNALRPSSISS